MRYNTFAIVATVFLAGNALTLHAVEDETLAERRARLERMTDAEKTRLLQKKQHFYEGLSGAERERYRELHKELSSDPQYEKLRGTLQRYNDWIRTQLDTIKRDELSKLPAKERLAFVKQLMDAQATDRFRLMVSEAIKSNYVLSREDLDAICAWTDKFLIKHREEILAADPDDPFAADVLRDFEPTRHIHYLRMKYFRPGFRPFRSGPPDGDPGQKKGAGNAMPKEGPQAEIFERLPKPKSDELADLEAEISRDARDELHKATEEADRSQVVQNWMRAAVFSRFAPPVSPADLEAFAASDELAPDERRWLESMPRDRMFHELRKLYFRKRFQRGRWGGRRRDGGRYGRDGKSDGPGFERGRGPRGGQGGGGQGGGGQGGGGQGNREGPGARGGPHPQKKDEGPMEPRSRGPGKQPAPHPDSGKQASRETGSKEKSTKKEKKEQTSRK